MILDPIDSWKIDHRIHYVKDITCLKPYAKCEISRKPLFLKKAVKIVTRIHGPGTDVIEIFYINPQNYTLWLFQHKAE